MSTSAIDSQGVLVQLGDGASPEVFTSIAEITSPNFEGGEVSERDVTDINSTVKVYKPGLRDAQRMTAEINYIPKNTQHAAMRAAYKAKTLLNYKVVFTDASPTTTWTFAAYVTAFPVAMAVDEVVKSSLTLLIDASGITEA